MRVLLDECLPKQLWRLLPGHDVWTAPQKGMAGKRNGELLSLLAAAGFEVLLTVDQNIVHQQNLKIIRVSLIVMFGATNALEDLAPLIPRVLEALKTIQPGDVVEIRS